MQTTAITTAILLSGALILLSCKCPRIHLDDLNLYVNLAVCIYSIVGGYLMTILKRMDSLDIFFSKETYFVLRLTVKIAKSLQALLIVAIVTDVMHLRLLQSMLFLKSSIQQIFMWMK